MGQIQNAINSTLGSLALVSHLGSQTLEPLREMKEAGIATKLAQKDVRYYGDVAREHRKEINQLINEGKLDEAQQLISDYSGDFELEEMAERRELETMERERELKAKHGTPAQRKSALMKQGDVDVNRAIMTRAQDTISSLTSAIEEKRGIIKANEERLQAIEAEKARQAEQERIAQEKQAEAERKEKERQSEAFRKQFELPPSYHGDAVKQFLQEEGEKWQTITQR